MESRLCLLTPSLAPQEKWVCHDASPRQPRAPRKRCPISLETAHPWIRARKQGLAVRSQPVNISEYRGIPYGSCLPRMSRLRDGQVQNPQGSTKLPPLGAKAGLQGSLTLYQLLRVFNGALSCGSRVGEASQDGCWKEDSGNLAVLLHEHPGDRHAAAGLTSSPPLRPRPLRPLVCLQGLPVALCVRQCQISESDTALVHGSLGVPC